MLRNSSGKFVIVFFPHCLRIDSVGLGILLLKMSLCIHSRPSFVFLLCKNPIRLTFEVCVSHRVRHANQVRLHCMSDQLVTEDLVISCTVVARRRFGY
jgi:hypothetical protein